MCLAHGRYCVHTECQHTRYDTPTFHPTFFMLSTSCLNPINSRRVQCLHARTFVRRSATTARALSNRASLFFFSLFFAFHILLYRLLPLHPVSLASLTLFCHSNTHTHTRALTVRNWTDALLFLFLLPPLYIVFSVIFQKKKRE